MDDPEKYRVHEVFSGVCTVFDDPISAAEAFYRADAAQRPSVYYSNARSSRLVANTMRIGDEIVKDVPFDTDPDFVQAYLAVKRRELE